MICSAHDIAFVCTGGSKKDALFNVLGKGEEVLPSGLVVPEKFGGKGGVSWFVDRAAMAFEDSASCL